MTKDLNLDATSKWAVTGQSEGGRYITIKNAGGRVMARVPFNTPAEVERGEIDDAERAEMIVRSVNAYPDLLAENRRLLGVYREVDAARDTLVAERDALRDAAKALIDDVRRRYPGEPLRCPLMIALDAALAR